MGYFHMKYAEIFRNHSIERINGIWKVSVEGRDVLIPLRPVQLWLDWDTALSVLGQDIEIKETYLALINSFESPKLFIDVGANYGHHSIIFLNFKIKTISFEPNTLCHQYYRELCARNNITPRLERVALGDSIRNVELFYPAQETWMGTIEPNTVNRLSSNYELKKDIVLQRKLDDYFYEFSDDRVLIKIDTEGSEYSILKGSQKIMKQFKPKIIFECWIDGDRTKIYDLLTAQNYLIYHLPWSPNKISHALKSVEFLASRATNFIAMSG
jgi:FkbM family methyltransferase